VTVKQAYVLSSAILRVPFKFTCSSCSSYIGGRYWRTLWARMFGDMRRLYAWREQLQEVSCSVKGGPLDFYIPLDAQLPETKGGASCSSKSVFLCG